MNEEEIINSQRMKSEVMENLYGKVTMSITSKKDLIRKEKLLNNYYERSDSEAEGMNDGFSDDESPSHRRQS